MSQTVPKSANHYSDFRKKQGGGTPHLDHVRRPN